jgi:glycosyltransferase involved in cell wall biosynthesis
MPITIIMPAHNEESVILRSLEILTHGARPGELDVIVVCNGCRDRTAEIARAFGYPVRAVETDIPSKSNALNLGDEAATDFPRIYCDADVLLSLESVREMARALKQPGVLAAAPAVKNVFPQNASWPVRAYYDCWMALPYVQEGMMAAGVYAANEPGRKRFDRFPDLISDDGFFRLQFSRQERIEVKSALSIVAAPASLWCLILIKTRSRLGLYQLKERFPGLFCRGSQSKNYGNALRAILKQPTLWPASVPYLFVNFVSRYRARRQFAKLTRGRKYLWERDSSSRPIARSATAAVRSTVEAKTLPH